jgi:hypothetical protein
MQRILMLSILVLAAGLWGSPGYAEVEEASKSGVDYESILGQWQRPDGGYLITIKSVEPDGSLDASYANPAILPFSTAEVSRTGDSISLFFEIQAGGYNGSTYTLLYDEAQDVLQGVYFQAVANQKYDIMFRRVTDDVQ